jgi:hypothetical protein
MRLFSTRVAPSPTTTPAALAAPQQTQQTQATTPTAPTNPAATTFSTGGTAQALPPALSGPRQSVVAVQASTTSSALTPEQAASAALNAKVIKKYPKLAAICADPKKLMADFSARFEAQKLKTPGDAYQFDVADIAVPILDDMRTNLATELVELRARHATLSAKVEARGLLAMPWTRSELHQLERGISYIQTLHDDVAAQHDSGTVPYRTLQTLGFFTARALGLFDMKQINRRDRALLQVDRYMQGYNGVRLDEEIERYAKKDFKVFDLQSPVGGFRQAHESFVDAFFDPDRLRMISLPFADSLGPEPFTRLVPYNIFLMGMTREPAAADGFVRPGGDFWIHDVRHSSAIFEERERYVKAHAMSPAALERFQGLQDRWKVELDAARADIPSKELRYAIGFIMFNFHHDRGYTLAPSSYEHDAAIDKVPRLLYMMLHVSGQHTGFKNVDATMNEAQTWLKAFWGARAAEERSVWNT